MPSRPFAPSSSLPACSGLDDETIERFDGVADPRLVTLDCKPFVIGRDPDARFTVRDDIVFHGGPGTTLAMHISGAI